ncbi:putative oligosaccharyl transferase subunit Dad1 [Aspergillus mulundensis]|uniref:Dolichyl-diphosphooligosaccharide--protein glycosyltransferase subunit OST2 n=1 Tax=Aspergillus mulundensis TaxID=1810919 RepID=A0A3D8T4P0_9EURO|nr:Dolichyl-diphosphooligosaccharide--protein glycosyltransferase subunit OST2 [Aspergillus mulundensis]RDW93537.1 Dolichyl-diphosphooligosaccharide--protein glycosyltransferase subunit OST2 [Aspergillus mulundensis]
MPSKRPSATPSSSSAPAPSSASSSGTSTPLPTLSSGPKTLSANSSVSDIAIHVWQQYLTTTPQRTMLLDAFMAFLVLVGGVQFAYCVLAGNYPFNAFLSGFCAAVGQFVLTASLRMQTSSSEGVSSVGKGKVGKVAVAVAGRAEGADGGISHER